MLLTGSGEMVSPDDDVAFHAAIADGHPQPPVRAGHPRSRSTSCTTTWPPSSTVYYNEPGGAVALQQQHDAIRQRHQVGRRAKARQAMRHHLDYVARGLAQLVGAGRVIRLVFIDLDGTLLSGPRHISERARRTIAAVREAGVEVVLVSSRPPAGHAALPPAAAVCTLRS